MWIELFYRHRTRHLRFSFATLWNVTKVCYQKINKTRKFLRRTFPSILIPGAGEQQLLSLECTRRRRSRCKTVSLVFCGSETLSLSPMKLTRSCSVPARTQALRSRSGYNERRKGRKRAGKWYMMFYVKYLWNIISHYSGWKFTLLTLEWRGKKRQYDKDLSSFALTLRLPPRFLLRLDLRSFAGRKVSERKRKPKYLSLMLNHNIKHKSINLS